jgi:hypothetical protein
MKPVAVAIMAKRPRAREVKTRLSPPLSPDAAARLYRCFLLDKIEQVRALRDAQPVLAYVPADAQAEFAALAPDFTLVAQQGPDLGARLRTSLATLLARGHRGALAIDSDTPTLPTSLLQRAVDVMADPTVDVVLGPTEDGGYYLIGMRAVRDELFAGIAWSTPRVMAETLRRAAAARLRTVRLAPWFDVDTPDDLRRLQASLGDLRDAAPAHTVKFLTALGRRLTPALG